MNLSGRWRYLRLARLVWKLPTYARMVWGIVRDPRTPLPLKALVSELSRFKQAEIVWCQEEPRNQGAWAFVQPYLEWVLEQIQATHQRPRYVGRAASASTATGLMSNHLKQLKAFLDEALG